MNAIESNATAGTESIAEVCVEHGESRGALPKAAVGVAGLRRPGGIWNELVVLPRGTGQIVLDVFCPIDEFGSCAQFFAGVHVELANIDLLSLHLAF